jgi:hypothetical protein
MKWDCGVSIAYIYIGKVFSSVNKLLDVGFSIVHSEPGVIIIFITVRHSYHIINVTSWGTNLEVHEDFF